MDYKEKYIAALERAKEYHDDGGAPLILEVIFPELKESEDELIRKAIKSGIKHLETQLGYDAVDGVDILNIYSWLEKQDEQTHAALNRLKVTSGQKLDPKFKVGDWVVSNNNGETWQIGARYSEEGQRIYLYNVNDVIMSITLDVLNNDYYFWTIRDAKDGDVLVASDGSIFLFAGVDDCACKFYVALTTDNYVKINKDSKGGYWETSRAVYPATKEQRDLLFQKMKEAGWEWDSEKKELKKVEVKMLDADKVIEWMRQNVCTACWDDPTNEIVSEYIVQFKKISNYDYI